MDMATLEHIVSDAPLGVSDAVERTGAPRRGELRSFGGVVTGILTGAVLWLGILGVILSQR